MKCRPASIEDRDQILEISTKTWDGWDYVPLLLDEWFKEGGIFVSEDKNEITGVTKTTRLSPGELWLEGIRVRKELRGQGIGKQLAFYQLGKALEEKPRVIRLSTAEVNTESIRLIEKMGFSLVHTFTYLELHNLKKRPLSGCIREAKEIPLHHGIMERSSFHSESKGLIPWSWLFLESTTELRSAYIASGNCFVYEMDQLATGGMLLLPHRYDARKIEVALIDAPNPPAFAQLFAFAINHAISHGKKELALFSPSKRLEDLARNAGFFYPYDFSKVLVYELIPS